MKKLNSDQERMKSHVFRVTYKCRCCGRIYTADILTDEEHFNIEVGDFSECKYCTINEAKVVRIIKIISEKEESE